MNTVRGRIHSVESFGTLDGPGIRYVLFLQGCPFRCLYCHNPDTWCGAGTETDSAAVVRDILRYRSFLSGGVTLSGGEPLAQPAFAAAILEGCRENGLHTALDTAGGVPLSVSRPALERADLLLLDVKAAEDGMFRRITGQGMENTLATLDECEWTGKPVWIRQVAVPGLTLEKGQLRALGELLRGYTVVERVELLPFHKMGEYKWKELGYGYTLDGVQPPSDGEMQAARALLREYGLPVR